MYKNKWKYFCWKHDTGLDRSSTQELILKHRENPRISWIFEHWTLNQSRLWIVLTWEYVILPASSPPSPGQYWLRPPRKIGLRSQFWGIWTFLAISQIFPKNFKSLVFSLPEVVITSKWHTVLSVNSIIKLSRRTWWLQHVWWLVDIIIQGEQSLTFSTVDWTVCSSPCPPALIIKFSIPFQSPPPPPAAATALGCQPWRGSVLITGAGKVSF